MAKKTAAKKTTTKKVAAPKPAKKMAASKPALTDHAIGDAAGEIWRLLTDNDELTLAALKKAASSPDDTTLMAIGWLAREGKLKFETKGRSVKVALA